MTKQDKIAQIVFKIKSEVTDLEENLEAILECNLPNYRDLLLNQQGHALLSAKIINETLLELGDIIRMEEEQ